MSLFLVDTPGLSGSPGSGCSLVGLGFLPERLPNEAGPWNTLG